MFISYNIFMNCEKHPDATFSPKGKCRNCNREYQSRWYASNKTKHKKRVSQKNKIYNEERQAFIYSYLLEHPCSLCNEKDPIVLTFHHVDPSTKKNTIAAMRGFSLSSIRSEIEKCQVLCFNCHMRVTAHERGWWYVKGTLPGS